MQKSILIIVFLFLASFAYAQAPMIVPNEVTVAGVRLKLNSQAKKDVEETLDLLTRSQYHFQLKVDRSNLYMHFVEEILKKEGIPEDFKYLAIQEGEFVSDAVSTSDAVGFWQFKKASAQELGLRVDNLVDERKHIIASTVGATKYLKRSNFVFDNWVLSMQSYLQGLTGTQRSVSDKLYGAKSMNITGKSHWYIKKFIAHKLAFQDFVGEGRRHPEVRLEQFEGRGKTLRQVSNEIDVDLEELKRFNKWLNQTRIPTEKSYKVIYPLKSGRKPVAEKKDSPKSSKEERSNDKTQTTTKPRVNTNSSKSSSQSVRDYYGIKPIEGNTGYFPEITGNLKSAYEPDNIRMNGIPAIRAKQGDDLASLARRTGKREGRLKRYNDIGDRGNIRAGKYYYLKNKKRKGQVHYHVVRSGETLWGISQDYGIRLKQLLRKNRMKDVEELNIGRVLWLRFIRPKDVPIEYANVIVETEKTNAEDQLIFEANSTYSAEKTTKKLKETKKPKRVEDIPEREIIKELPVLKPSQNQKVVIHRVEPKQTFFAISDLYKVDIDKILEWNNLKITDGLNIGQELQLIIEVPKDQKPEQVVHVVQKGETLWAIARKYSVSVDEIIKWNNKTDNSLALGEKLLIFAKN